MNRFSRRAGAAIFFGLCLALSAGAQDRKPIEKQPADKEPANEQEFLTHALDGNIHEVKMGELALKQTKNEEVRKFAQRMIDDHSKARDMLQNVAREMKIAVVEGTSPTKRERMDQLGKLEGTQFDKEYLRYMVESHEKGLARHEKWARDAKTESLREYARMTVPTVKDHLQQARRLAGAARD